MPPKWPSLPIARFRSFACQPADGPLTRNPRRSTRLLTQPGTKCFMTLSRSRTGGFGFRCGRSPSRRRFLSHQHPLSNGTTVESTREAAVPCARFILIHSAMDTSRCEHFLLAELALECLQVFQDGSEFQELAAVSNLVRLRSQWPRRLKGGGNPGEAVRLLSDTLRTTAPASTTTPQATKRFQRLTNVP